MELKEAQSQWLRRAYEIGLNRTQDPEFASMFAAKLYGDTRMNPTHSGLNGKGIANLKIDNGEVDPMNPEDAMQFAAERDAAVLEKTGDVRSAMMSSYVDGTDGQADLPVDEIMQNIIENKPLIEQALSTDEAPQNSFTEIDSPELRFRRAVSANDAPATSSVINEMINSKLRDGRKDGV